MPSSSTKTSFPSVASHRPAVLNSAHGCELSARSSMKAARPDVTRGDHQSQGDQCCHLFQERGLVDRGSHAGGGVLGTRSSYPLAAMRLNNSEVVRGVRLRHRGSAEESRRVFRLRESALIYVTAFPNIHATRSSSLATIPPARRRLRVT
jgi:hypothetical protein